MQDRERRGVSLISQSIFLNQESGLPNWVDLLSIVSVEVVGTLLNP